MKLVKESLINTKFKRGLTPRHVLGLDPTVEWMEDIRDNGPLDIKYEISKGGKINIISSHFRFIDNGNQEFHIKGCTIPRIVRFGEVKATFWLEECNLESLDSLPDYVYGDFYLQRVTIQGKRIKKSQIGYIEKTTHVTGTFLVTYATGGWYGIDSAMKSRRYRQSYPGKIKRSTRTTHKILNTGDSQSYSSGYKLYHALKYIEAQGDNGARPTDIRRIIFNISYPGEELRPGWGTSYVTKGGTISKYADKEDHRWVLNDKGRKYLEDHSYFDNK